MLQGKFTIGQSVPKPVFQPPATALPTAPVIQTKLKIGEPNHKLEEEADHVAVPSAALRPSQSGILQRKCACGGAAGMSGECEECSKKKRFGLQTKLKVNEPGDIYEQEADRIADQVIATPTHHALNGAPPRIQRFSGQSTGQMNAVPASIEHALASPGRPLEPALRHDMEQRFGHDFSRVRVHSDATAARSAKAISARAYTVGKNIVFAHGQYSPATSEGRWLLAHEIAHVAQQSESRSGSAAEPHIIRRSPDDGKMVSKTPAPAPGSAPAQPAQSTAPDPGSEDPAHGRLTQPEQPAEARVKLMTFDCKQKLLVIDAGSIKQSYQLQTCSLPLGSYTGARAPTVLHAGQRKPGAYQRDEGVGLKFPVGSESDKLFQFSYSLKPGKPNPATLLAGQDTVDVQVVENLAAPVEGGTGTTKEPSSADKPQDPSVCVIRLAARQLVAPDSGARPLFKPLELNQKVWTHSIPLGQFGFVDVGAEVTGSLTGTLSGSYGPGTLTDICLTRNTDKIDADHPLLKSGSPGTLILGGRARFRLPASARVFITSQAALLIAADYLKVIRVGSIKGGVKARGEAALDGKLDAMVDVVARFTSASVLDKIDLNAKVALQGHASLSFALDAFVAARFLGFELWREDWRLSKAANLGLGWEGGIQYSPNPGIHWLPGAIDKLVQLDHELVDDEEAAVDEDEVLGSLLDQSRGTQTTPDGLSRQNALPFTWHKPLDMYPETLDIPNAEDPKQLHRDNGPTTVTRNVNQGGGRSRTEYERIGVDRGNWVGEGKYLQYVPHAVESRAEQDRLRDLLTDLGFDRSGTEIDHVRDLHLGGKDHFSNLWPLDQATNSAAGPRHQTQLENYEQQFAARNLNLNGRIFVISDVTL